MDTITLIEPAADSVTPPLQQYQLHVTAASEAAELDSPGAVYAWNNLQAVAADRSVPRPVAFVWERVTGGWRSPGYELTVSRSPGLDDAPLVLSNLSRPHVEVWHLFIGATYYWRVRAYRADALIAESAVNRFTTNSLPPRWIRVPGITNMRDIGGWPLPGGRTVRQGRVYRSSEMNGNLRLTRRGRAVLEEELGIRTDLDLRGDHEGASPALDPARVRWIHAPISPYDCIRDASFRDGYRLIFETFADPANYPIVFHCVGGADRGGTVAFLLNALLGKAREQLLRDYELTTLSVWGERSRSSEQFRGLIEALKDFSADPDDLQNQVETYMRSIGLSDAAIAAIRRQLIVDSPPSADLA